MPGEAAKEKRGIGDCFAVSAAARALARALSSSRAAPSRNAHARISSSCHIIMALAARPSSCIVNVYRNIIKIE